MRYLKVILSICLIAVLVSCVSGTAVPRDHFYRLPEVRSGVKLPTNIKLSAMLQVKSVAVEGLLNDRNLLYVDSKKPYEIQKYFYHQWNESPSVMLRDHLVDFLASTGISDRVAPFSYSEKNTYILNPRLEKMEILYDKGVANLQVVMFVDITDPQAKRLISKKYQAQHAVNNSDIHAIVVGYGEVLKKIYNSLMVDLYKMQ